MLRSVTISPYKKNSELGQKARFLIEDLSSCDRIFNTNCAIHGQDEPYENFEESTVDNPDCCIQYVQFANFIRTGYKNIGIFEPFFRDLSEQENYLKLLDTIVVRSDAQKKIFPSSIREKVVVARPSIGLVPRQSAMKKIGGSLNFYISALEEHSNLDKVLSAYLQTFTINDNVALNILSLNPEDMSRYIQPIVEGFSKYTTTSLYPVISVQNNSSIHQASDCFIDMGMSYEISLQTMIAAAYSNPIISCNNDGLMQWLDKDCCYLVNSHEGCRDSSLVGNIPEILSLSKAMRRAYENREEFKDKQNRMLDDGYRSFYYTNKQSVGETICSLY